MPARRWPAVQPIYLFGDKGPFVAEVVLVFAALSIPHRIISIKDNQIAHDVFYYHAPTGRAPLIYDPNSAIYVSESSPIISYVLEKYDHYHMIAFPRHRKEHFLSKSLHAFQSRCVERTSICRELLARGNESIEFHLEKCIEEIEVVERVLTENQQRYGANVGPYILGYKMSYLDLVFCCWIDFLHLSNPRPIASQFGLTRVWFRKMIDTQWVLDVLESCRDTPEPPPPYYCS
ncbi:hypothetical protein F4801DRAFT_351286 [Xylaria longipes]|nr:hypothetical protein F4801DRAFT_351286 [Xylaria longipes]RYC64122.1 hypothetical protein CHU98_g2066 [Xylaria longipes]